MFFFLIITYYSRFLPNLIQIIACYVFLVYSEYHCLSLLPNKDQMSTNYIGFGIIGYRTVLYN